MARRCCDHTAFSLRSCQPGRYFFERREMLINVRFCVLHRDRPLFIPPIGLRENAAVHHAEPIVPPQIDVNLGPVAIVADLFGYSIRAPLTPALATYAVNPAFATIVR